MTRVPLIVGVLIAFLTVRAAAKSAMNPEFTYSFWRDVKNPNQFYAISTGWRLTYPRHVSRKITTMCRQYVTPAPRPFEHGWELDHSVTNRGVQKGWIMSRNAAGFTAPNAAAEMCMAQSLRHTYPTLEIALLCSLTIGLVGAVIVILCLGACCAGVGSVGMKIFDARKRRSGKEFPTGDYKAGHAPAGDVTKPYSPYYPAVVAGGAATTTSV